MFSENGKKYIMDWKTFFSFRSVWMLIAIIWIVVFHSFYNFKNPVLNFINNIGYGGVDVFFFASGIGCFFSLKKDSDIVSFIKRRAKNILPMYLIFLIFFIAYYKSFRTVTLVEIIGNITGLGFTDGLKNQFNWYIFGIWACYFLAPFFVRLSERVTGAWGRIAVISVLLFFSFTFFGHTGKSMLLFWSRLPIYFIGVCFAEFSTRSKGLSLKFVSVMLALSVAGYALMALSFYKYTAYLWSYGLWWYPFILIVPGICIVISFVCQFVSKTPLKVLVNFTKFLGNYTLPVFLTHLLIIKIYEAAISKGRLPGGALGLLLFILCTVSCSYILVELERFVKFIWEFGRKKA